MLQVQVEYLKHLENKRHNLVQEDIGYKQVDIGYKTINETIRHNTVSENQNQQQINESIRHNRATEAIGYMQANAALQQAETSRMLANAQVPLIEMQAKNTRNQAYLNYYKAQNESATVNFNKLRYGVSEDALNETQDFGVGLAVGKLINEIIPF